MSASCTSRLGVPSAIHSAMILPTPPAWATHTASADQKPRTTGDSPRIGMPSTVNENMPFSSSAKGASLREGTRSITGASASENRSGLKGAVAGVIRDRSYGRMSSESTRSGSCR